MRCVLVGKKFSCLILPSPLALLAPPSAHVMTVRARFAPACADSRSPGWYFTLNCLYLHRRTWLINNLG